MQKFVCVHFMENDWDVWMKNEFFKALVTGIFTYLFFQFAAFIRLCIKYESWTGEFEEYQLIQGKWEVSHSHLKSNLHPYKREITVNFLDVKEEGTFVIFEIDKSFPQRLSAQFFQRNKAYENTNWGNYFIEQISTDFYINDREVALIGYKCNILDEKRYGLKANEDTDGDSIFTPQPMNYKRIAWVRK